MRIIALDFETFFSNDFTLSKLTTENYVRDPRFIAHGAAIKWDANQPARWYDEPSLRLILAKEDWSDVAIVCHHANFDGLVLSQHYSVRPKVWLDTLSMARLLLGNHLSVSLDSVRKYFNLPAKRTPYELFKGKHWHELTPDIQTLVAEGCCDEVESIWTLFNLLAKDFPTSEYPLVDMTVRMFTEPALRGDIELLGRIWIEEETKKKSLSSAIEVSAKELGSNERFSALLENEGIEIIYKQGKNGPIPAFAKTDEFMQELLEHDEPRVAALARARLGIKSTAIQTRAETLGHMTRRGPLCVYLRYAAASTTRWGGGDDTNFQNFKRGHALRNVILAPEGFDLAVIDASQIEARVLNYLAGQWDVLERFADPKQDPYAELASQFYGEPVYKPKDDDPRYAELTAKRGAGKQGELMCGYGCGGARFAAVARQGLYGPPIEMDVTEGERRVGIYRHTHKAVVEYWGDALSVLGSLHAGSHQQWGPLTIRDHKIFLPTGLMMHYDTLEWHSDDETGDQGWRLKTRRGWRRIWGSKLVQNVCEMVARAIVAEAAVRISQQGLRIVGMSHDELWILIPQEASRDFPLGQEYYFNWCLQQMRTMPAWLPDIPLDAEGTMGERYAK